MDKAFLCMAISFRYGYPFITRIGIFSSPAAGLTCAGEMGMDIWADITAMEGETYDEARKRMEGYIALNGVLCPSHSLNPFLVEGMCGVNGHNSRYNLDKTVDAMERAAGEVFAKHRGLDPVEESDDH